MKASIADITERLIEIISQLLRIKHNDILLTDSLQPMGADSLDILELSMLIEDEFAIDLDIERVKLTEQDTINDWITLIKENI